MAGAGLDLATVLDIPGSQVPGGFETEFMRNTFGAVNFALIIVARKGASGP